MWGITLNPKPTGDGVGGPLQEALIPERGVSQNGICVWTEHGC